MAGQVYATKVADTCVVLIILRGTILALRVPFRASARTGRMRTTRVSLQINEPTSGPALAPLHTRRLYRVAGTAWVRPLGDIRDLVLRQARTSSPVRSSTARRRRPVESHHYGRRRRRASRALRRLRVGDPPLAAARGRMAHRGVGWTVWERVLNATNRPELFTTETAEESQKPAWFSAAKVSLRDTLRSHLSQTANERQRVSHAKRSAPTKRRARARVGGSGGP